MRQVILACVFGLCSVGHAFAQTIAYQSVKIHPGDVINFHGGDFTTGGFLEYGHSALYLGLDPQTRERVFLDFTASETWGGGAPKKNERAFIGRILPEREFLMASAATHA